MDVEREQLVGSWLHAHEEDAGAETVFRPADAELPPSRGRTGFELRADGSFAERKPGPGDAPEGAGGSWRLEDGDRLVLEGGSAARRAFEVVSAEPDRLALRRL